MTQEKNQKNHPNPLTSRKPATFDRSANDDTPEHLVAAHHNWLLVKSHWCQGHESEQEPDTVYYRDKRSGSHGWACGTCRGIVQTG